MSDPFELNDAVIRDFKHVKVVRHASRDSNPCRYEKIFKSEGIGGAAYWMRRENDFLLDFRLKHLSHTVQIAGVDTVANDPHTPIISSVMRSLPYGSNLPHTFVKRIISACVKK
ncbi:MAG: hypothetical protein ACKN9T_10220 [Candidatus Methylumidiphilus sp.]